MNFTIKHEIRGRIRLHIKQPSLSYEQADRLQYYLQKQDCVTSVKVYERTSDVTICYIGEREQLLELLKSCRYNAIDAPDGITTHSGRTLNAEYKDKLISKLLFRAIYKAFFPYPLRIACTTINSLRYIYRGAKCLKHGKLEVPVLDAVAIGVSMLRGDTSTASSIMFFLSIGELLEDWTHKKSVGNLARSMSLNIKKVWCLKEGKEHLISADEIRPGDTVIVRMGNVIPFDGAVISGEAMVNQASMTGESLPVKKAEDSYVYAGTVIEEGELQIKVTAIKGDTRFEKIITMIEETEKLKSASVSKAEHLADKLVSYMLAGTFLTWLLTRSITKALSVLLVDFSCALKLAMPVTVLSAIREAGSHGIVVKGGKYLEAVSESEVIVFDKTGTLTKAKPVVKVIVSFREERPEEMLKIAACLEEHFPHSLAKAVVEAAKQSNLEHEEMHSKVHYIVAHGIVSSIRNMRVVIGSYHFVFEDEKCIIPEGCSTQFDTLPEEYSQLYMAIDGVLAAVICIEDPLRNEAKDIVHALKNVGIKKVVMLTGDSERTAASIADKISVDDYFSEVLPEQKAEYIKTERAKGNKVIMIGDGINDSPALSAANAGIAISDGAEIAREIADIIIKSDNLYEIVTLKKLSSGMTDRVNKNYRTIVGFNGGLICLGVAGVITPATSALLHNVSTLAITLKSMSNLL